jgi:hypothetical protein
VKTQAPGFYRMMLGQFEVTVLSDGTFKLNLKELLTNTTPDKIDPERHGALRQARRRALA